MDSSASSAAEIDRIFEEMEAFEASESQANTGTGSRREGEHFETLVATLWEALVTQLLARGVSGEIVVSGSKRWARLSRGGRAIYLPAKGARSLPLTDHGQSWLRLNYLVSDLVAAFPGAPTAIAQYAPRSGEFAGTSYEAMFSGLMTHFDAAILFERDGVLAEKALLEYKTAKSSAGRQIDGNAHERLSFQVMQYLEVATRYPKCSLYVITNGAYIRYRNKYHVNFKVQADRLTAFSWFSMNFLSHREEYQTLVSRLVTWLYEETVQSA
jgi:hypothetical protein